MFNQPRRLPRQPLSEPVDLLLADVAIRVQLSRTDHAEAEQRYDALGDHLDRDGSLLQGRVELIYPQGSVAGCPLDEMRVIMADLFGEAPAEQAFRAFNERFGDAIRQGRSRYSTDGGRLSLPASGLVAGAAPSIARASPRHSFYGTEFRRR